MISLEFNNETDILMVKMIEDITIDEILDYINEVKKNKSYPRNLKSLIDGSNASTKFKIRNLSKIVKINNEALKNYESFIDAIILRTPKETALAMFFGLLSKNKRHKFKVFSTEKSALNWLSNY